MFLRTRATRALGLIGVASIIALACTPTTEINNQSKEPTVVKQSTIPAPVAVAPAAPGAPAPGPNLLAKDWGSRLGIIVSDLKPATGQALINPKAGDLYFFSNSSTAWGATNTNNAVWVIDAKTKQTVAEVAPADGKGNSSHGIAVSGDGKYVYLSMLGSANHIDVLDGRTFEIVQTITTLGRPHHQKLFHDANTGKDLIIGEDFNWNFSGSGFYVLDPSQKNALVGGLSNGDFEGNPYVSAGTPDGKFIVVTVPAPMSSFRDKMDGWVGKVDAKTWKVVGLVPMVDPLYPVISPDSQFAYITSGGEARVHKIDIATMKDLGEVQTGPGPWGAAISYDGTKLYTADKGEGPGYNQQGRTSTVIDLATLGVSNVIPIGITTDHALLSPDGSEIWYTSNAEHAIYVADAKTEKIKTVIKDPADGDVHGGVWVQYKDDGKGGVIGEVVADYAGLHGSALTAQQAYLAQPSVTIALNGSGFLQKSVSVVSGQRTRLLIKNTAGTNGGKITFESADLGIKSMTLESGQVQELTGWTAPTETKDYMAKTNKSPNGTIAIKVVAASVVGPSTTAAPAAGPRQIVINSKNFLFDVSTVEVKTGETVRFVLTNADDEKHNLVGIGNVNLLSPDVGSGGKITYDWTAPQNAQTIKVICAYHASATFNLVVK